MLLADEEVPAFAMDLYGGKSSNRGMVDLEVGGACGAK
jgi:hypothetical protein